MNQLYLKSAVDQLLQMFADQSFPQAVAHTVIARKSGDTRPCAKWSLANQLIAQVVGGTQDARTFLQWKTVSRFPIKGTSAFYIFAPCKRKYDLEPDESGEVRSSERLFGFKPLPVFAYESTQGADLPSFDYTPAQPPQLWRAAERLGLKVSYAPFDGRALGRYRPHDQHIFLSSSDHGVWFHELAHAAHFTFETRRHGILQHLEICAELSAAVLLELTNISGYQHASFEYIKRYCADKDDQSVLKNILAVLSDVERIVNIIWDAAAEATETEAVVKAPELIPA